MKKSEASAAENQDGLRTKRGRRRRAALAFALSSVLLLLGLEFAARWYSLNGGKLAFDSAFGTTFAASKTTAAKFVPHPELGYWRNPEHPSHNSVGLRGDEAMLGPRSKDHFRILVIGDSVAEPIDGFVSLIEAGLQEAEDRPVEVINGAVPGYTTLQERLYLAHILPSLDVDLVLLQYCLNDNYDFLHLMTTQGSRLLTLEAKSHLFPDTEGFLGALTRSSYLVYGLRKKLYQRGIEAPAHPWEDPIFGAAWNPDTWGKQREHLQSVAELLADQKVKFAMVVVPHESQLDPRRTADFPDRIAYPQEQLQKICKDQNTPHLDLLPTFASSETQELYTDGIHLNQEGHQLAATAILNFLELSVLD
ncbi:MAG: SGNH/GDSL hydrolase family protein [Planctomycetota bacterium]|nr:SGNH/GDSL hydrolase family protein [Planctomycetota bacterium]